MAYPCPMSSEGLTSASRVVVVGAGLAGLTCAVELASRGIDCLVVEASDGIGGRVRTDVVDGFRLDRGFQVLLTAYPEARRALDYGALRLKPFFPGAVIRAGGRFRRLADPWRAPVAAVTGVLSGVVPPTDALRIARLRHRLLGGVGTPKGRRSFGPTSDRLAAEGFSNTAIKRFFRPFFGGVFLDPELGTSERQMEFVFRMFASGDIAIPALGMGEIPAQLAARLPGSAIRTHCRVDSVDGTGVRLDNGDTLDADAVVVAVDAGTAHRLGVVSHEPRWRTTTCVYFDAPVAPIGGPALILNGEGEGPVNNLCVMSEVSPEVAPPGSSLVSVTVIGRRHETEAGEAGVRAQLAGWFGETVNQWRHLRSYSIDRALPAYEEPLEAEASARVRNGLFVCGDYLADPSINGAMSSGRFAAEAVAAQLEGATR